MDVSARKVSPVLTGGGLFLLSLSLTWLGHLARGSEWLPVYPVAAVLFGLLVRFPALARAKYWLAMFGGMLAADMYWNGAFEHALWISACLLVQVLSACALLTMRPLTGLYEPKNALHLFLVAIVSVALGATLATPFSLTHTDQHAASLWLTWFSEQFVSMMLVAPVFICWPARLRGYRLEWAYALPLGTLLLMIGVARLVGGPGSIAFMLPALLWCAMRYRIFTLSLIVMCVGSFELIHASASFDPSEPLRFADSLCSVRLGVAMLVLSPLLVATATHANQQLLAQLQHSANHDFLTGTLTRRAFTQKAKSLLRLRGEMRESLALIVLDLDHFKAVNDTYGHGAGDQVLREFAQVISEQLRTVDVFGRMGGEEFVLLLPGVSQNQGLSVAERLRHAVQQHEFKMKGATLNISVSMGLSWLPAERSNTPFSLLFEQADEALYQAKAQGRNQVCTHMVRELALEKLKLSIY